MCKVIVINRTTNCQRELQFTKNRDSESARTALLGVRVEIKSISLFKPYSDTVSINYMDREFRTAMAKKPDKSVKRGFTMHDGKFGIAEMVKTE